MYDDDDEEIIVEEEAADYGPASGGYGATYEDDGEEDDEEEDESAAGYAKKGFDDRAFVDQQAKDYEEAKRKKRAEIETLKHHRLDAQAKLSKKERELHQLELAIKKGEYLETRERVSGQSELETEGQSEREAEAIGEVKEIARHNSAEEKETEHERLLREQSVLKEKVNEASRKISLLEHELLRS